jgi:hypothetical protein
MCIALPFSLVYFVSLLFNKRHKYVHYLLPLLAVVAYVAFPSIFYLWDDGTSTNIFWPVMCLFLLTFGMYYARNRYLHNALLVVNFLVHIPILVMTGVLVGAVVQSLV